MLPVCFHWRSTRLMAYSFFFFLKPLSWRLLCQWLQFCCLCVQLPVGVSGQSRHEEVSQPHEPQRYWSGRTWAQPGRRGTPAQSPTPQHRVGPPQYCASGQFTRPPASDKFACAVQGCLAADTVINVFTDTRNQPDAHLREGTLHRQPRWKEDGAVFNQCQFIRHTWRRRANIYFLATAAKHLIIKAYGRRKTNYITHYSQV